MLPEPIRCLVVEDEEDAANILRRYIVQTPGLELIAVCRDTLAAETMLRGQPVELVFLDIDLPGRSGVSWLRSRKPHDVAVIFTTADAAFGAEGFELDAADYILKPFSYERFRRSLDRFLRLSTPRQAAVPVAAATAERAFLMVRVERLLQKVYLDDLRYIEAKRNHLLLYLGSGPVKVYQPIRALEERLPQPGFLRIHRSFIVAAGRIEAFSSAVVQVDGCRLPVGRSYQAAVQAALARP